ncbi:MAG: PAS domain S-box protein [Gemmatimonadaceae bacterium]|nr:PAS domain S-box protein [Gemmatimonadaceae bacterium]
MISTSTKLRLVVISGVLALLFIGMIAIVWTDRVAEAAGSTVELRTVQALLAVMLMLGCVLAWFAYASLQDDLTRRTRDEIAVRSSEAKFAGILEIAADAIISVDEQQRILHFNRGAERIFGYAASEAIGQHLGMLMPARYRGGHDGHLRGFGQARDTARQMGDRREIFGLHKDGTEFPAEASISKLSMVDGKQVFTVLLRDVTERKLREEASRHLTQAVAVLGETLEVDATEQSIVQLPVPWLADGAILDVMGSAGDFHRVVSTSADPEHAAALRAVGGHRLDLDSPSRVVDVLRLARAEMVPLITDDWLEARTADLGEFERMRALKMHSLILLPLIAREHVLGVLQIYRREGRPVCTTAERAVAEELALRAAFALDNSRLYATARQATHARDHALGVVSHDLRNPISAIGMSARALMTSLPSDDGDRRSLVTNILQSQDLTQRMIRDLLDVANIEVGRLSVERRNEDVLPIMERAVSLFQQEAHDRGVTLRLEPPAPMPLVVGDAERLVQVLSNLIGNALRYTERDGAITLRAVRVADEVEISVEDTGSGIPSAAMPLIFERYWTVRGNAPKGGTGLGLAIARGIIEALGGRLWADSEVGKGSTFRFTVRVVA